MLARSSWMTDFLAKEKQQIKAGKFSTEQITELFKIKWKKGQLGYYKYNYGPCLFLQVLQIFFSFWSAALRAGRATEFQMSLCVWLINADNTVGSREVLYTWIDWDASPLPSFCCKLFSAETVLVCECVYIYAFHTGLFSRHGPWDNCHSRGAA